MDICHALKKVQGMRLELRAEVWSVNNRSLAFTGMLEVGCLLGMRLTILNLLWLDLSTSALYRTADGFLLRHAWCNDTLEEALHLQAHHWCRLLAS